MKSSMYFLKPISAIAISLLVTGCGGEPSESDMKSVFQKDLAVMAQNGNPGPEILSFNKVGCKEDGENAYKCDVEMALKWPGQSPTDKNIMKYRFIKGSDGWTKR